MNDIFIEECRNDFLHMNGGDSTTQSTSKIRSTKTDIKLNANLSIKELLDSLQNAVNELGCLHERFSSDVEVYTKREK